MVFIKSNFRWTLLLILAAMTVFFLLALPVNTIDRTQEHWYLGFPFELLKTGRMWIDRQDPFPENGPANIYVLAKTLHLTGSLLVVRLLQWPWALITAGFLWLLAARLMDISRLVRVDALGYALLALLFWITLPLGFVYPVQTNGFMAGFACAALGLLWLRTHPWAAMFAFGFAYSCKAQFIMFFPCVIAYRLVLDYSSKGLARHLGEVLRDTVLLFVPAVVIWPAVFSVFGLFRTSADLMGYALEGPHLLSNQLMAVWQKIFGGGEVDPIANVRRVEILRSELASYSKLVYMHIFVSVALGFAGLAWAVWARLPEWWGGRRIAGPPPEIALISMFVCVGWLTYFRFNNYPYCYNMLPVLPFSFVLVPFALSEIRTRFPSSWWKGIYILAFAALLFLVFRYTRNFLTLPPGDALVPYYWMQGHAWSVQGSLP